MEGEQMDLRGPCKQCGEDFEAFMEFPTAPGMEPLRARRSLCEGCAQQKADEERAAERRHAEASREATRQAALQRIPPLYRGVETTNPDVLAWAAQFIRGETRRGLLLVGPVGTGKTHAACAAWAGILGQDPEAEVMFWRTSALLAALRPDSGYNHAEVTTAAERADLLILDDLGVSKQSEWVVEQLLGIIDYRYGWQLPLIGTSNLGAEGLEDRLGERIARRIGALCDLVSMTRVWSR